MSERIQSFEEFWPYYLSEHRSPASRRLHFVGTSGWVASVLGSLAINPLGMGAAMAAFAAIAKDGIDEGEGKGPRLRHVAAMLGVSTLASPVLFPAGVVFAYGCAWIGHFGIENNRPATFQYPLWSLRGDFRMLGHMLRGRLWNGDPLEELGLDDPTVERDVPVSTIYA